MCRRRGKECRKLTPEGLLSIVQESWREGMAAYNSIFPSLN